MAEEIKLDGHHRATVEKIFRHPASHNIQWHDVLSLLESVAEVTERHGAKYKVTLGPETETLEPASSLGRNRAQYGHRAHRLSAGRLPPHRLGLRRGALRRAPFASRGDGPRCCRFSSTGSLCGPLRRHTTKLRSDDVGQPVERVHGVRGGGSEDQLVDAGLLETSDGGPDRLRRGWGASRQGLVDSGL
jgi:hypothetical protein